MNLLDLFVKIAVDDQASGPIETIAGKLEKGLEAASKIGLMAVSAASTGIVTLAKGAVENYAEYEQLEGGAETLFKNSADRLMGYADSAYKTAGLSANDYLSTATSFAASLISSLEGDTDAAVEYANMAITDMSDNANKMGTDVEMIQNAYQGFAKGNYTMLDNLKLGYGGTATEMARLVNESGLLSEAQQINLTDTKNIGNALREVGFDTIVEAIHEVQTEMGISGITAEEAAAAVASGAMTQEEAFNAMGTTAKEASDTISGSLSSAGAAWQNLLTDLADGDADLELSIDQFVDSVVVAADNLIPAIEQALTGIEELIDRLFPEIMERIPVIMNEVLPDIVESAVSIVETFVQGLSDNQEMIADTTVDTMMLLVDSASEQLPAIIELAATIIESLVGGIGENQKEIVDSAFIIITTLIESSLELLPDIVAVGLQILESIAEGIIEHVPSLIETATEVITELARMLLEPEMIMRLNNASTEILVVLAEGLTDAIPQLMDTAVEIILRFVDYMLSPGNRAEMIAMSVEMIGAIVTGLLTAAAELGAAALTLVSEILYAFGDADWVQLGKDTVNGILEGLKRTWDDLTDWFDESFDKLLDSILELLGIHSPSRVFADIGENMALGVGEGWGKAFDDISDDIGKSMDFERSLRINSDVSGGRTSGSANRGSVPGVAVTQNIYASKMTPSEVMAEALYFQKKAVLFGV